jgi:peptidoglycan/LPS O-acetylase OafA/YrhL
MVALYVVGRSTRVSPTLFDGTIPAWTYLAGLQNVWMTFGKNYGAPWLGGTWSLAIEEQFYLIFPALVFVRSLRSLRSMLITLMMLCPLMRIWAYWYGDPFAGYGYYFLTPFRADNLAVGALIAWYESSDSITPRARAMTRCTLTVTACLFPIYAAVISKHTDMHMALWGHTYLVFFYGSLLFFVLQNKGALQLAFLRSKQAEFFAKISYALYLVHICVALSLSLAFGVSREVSTWSGLLLAASAFVVSVGICWLSFKFLEGPLIKMAHQRYRYENEAVSDESGRTAAEGTLTRALL